MIAQAFVRGVVVGAAVTGAAVAGVLLRRRRRNDRASVVIESGGGSLLIRAKAIRSFVSLALREFPEVSLRSVTVRQNPHEVFLHIEANVPPTAQVAPAVGDLRRAVTQELTERLGIDIPILVEVSVRDVAAPESRFPGELKHTDVPIKKASPSPVAESTQADDAPEPDGADNAASPTERTDADDRREAEA